MAKQPQGISSLRSTPTDAPFEEKFGAIRNALEEGFAASSGVRNETAETSGHIRHPETGDEPILRRHDPLNKENSGTA